jgi:hypothetical protein
MLVEKPVENRALVVGAQLLGTVLALRLGRSPDRKLLSRHGFWLSMLDVVFPPLPGGGKSAMPQCERPDTDIIGKKTPTAVVRLRQPLLS